ncbi:hypothetical protein PRZ48_000457 [Zasmidium cellare]|uniref:Uncharacterized protein n=1 Tax=Zasmidium cellare TaxID=395010 RepID=A0ABR0EYJ0_ZASCE|nr:hypothetical protein PRZ48_000457 [Zasmidium cellare]
MSKKIRSSEVTTYANNVTTGSHATDLPSSFNSRLLFPTTISEATGTLSAAATPSVVTVVSTQGPPIAGATSPPTGDVESKEADPEKEHNATPHGAIAGIAVGATAGGVLLLAALWYFWRTRRTNGSAHEEGEKSTSPTPDPSRPTTNGSQGSPYTTSKSLTPIDTKNNSPISRFPGHSNRIHELGSPTGSAPELGSVQRYTVTNPDMTSPTETAPASPVEAPSSPYTIRPVRSSASLVSPIVDSTNRDSSVSALWPSPAGPPSSTFTPYTPSNYNPSAPSSVARTTNLQPPSLPQPYSAATFASSTQAPYTPSNYRSEAPESIPPALRPSVIPQEYSAATFESDSSLARSPGYRGLGEGRSGAPWEYLSAESAIGGGWVNESPTRREH